jgi:hypothetical protein
MPTPSLLIVPARFKTGTLYSQIPTANGDFTVTRNTAARRFDSAGLIESVASGIPRLDYYTSGGVTGCPALLVEPSGTNLALHSRDLSNAVWSGTNVTRAKNAVGADGVVSGATTLTATAASGTVLQALSHASQSRVFSAYVRRVTGTGAIQMTTNGGTNWTTVTISSLYTQVACAAQTVASGTVGFRMAVSGDVIEVDFTQGEVGPVATSPIPTTTGTGSRSADVISVSGAVSGSIGQTAGVFYADLTYSFKGTSSPNRWLQLFGASNNIGLAIATTNVVRSIVNGQSDILALAPETTGAIKIAWAYDGTGTAFFINGTKITLINGGAQTISSLTSLSISGSDNPQLANARIRAIALYNTRLTDAELITLTTP